MIEFWRACLFAMLISLGPAAVAVESAGGDHPELPITEAERDHWAYRPLSRPKVPEVAAQRFAAHAIDRFLESSRQRRGVEALPRAGKETLLRRVSLDLVGLPPTPTELREFLADHSPDAYEKVVDRLLAAPAYGERWAQQWLDLARFGETDGFEHDLIRPNAWRYRDWVIDALRRDMPFDEFIRQQIAGDELYPGDPDAAVATGFLLAGPDMPDLNLPDERRHLVLNEMTATVSAVVLGLQFGCAQCHDHKLDPIRQHDFYRLRAFFESSDLFRDHPIPTTEQLATRRAAEAANPADAQQRARRKALEELGQMRFREKNPDIQPTAAQSLAELTEPEREEHAALVERLKNAAKLPELPLGRVMRDGAFRESYLFLRGDFRQTGPIVACGFPRLLASPNDDLSREIEKPRAKLAAWLARGDNPLTPRVIVNRLWQWHFGVGLSESASDFGLMGSEPVHADLLDWLAQRFMDDGWSLKKMHRLLVTSAAYQSASSPFDPAWSAEETRTARAIWQRSSLADTHDDTLWHFRRRRLEGEALRDSMLAAAGQLSERRGGPGVRPPLSPEVASTLLADQWTVTGDEEDHRRRSIYLFVRRNLRYPMFDVFDRPDSDASCPRRHESTTATQSLVLLNSRFSFDCAVALAKAIVRDAPKNRLQQIREAYLRVLSRLPGDYDERLGLEFLDRQSTLLNRSASAESASAGAGADLADAPEITALAHFCLALFNSNAFVYVD